MFLLGTAVWSFVERLADCYREEIDQDQAINGGDAVDVLVDVVKQARGLHRAMQRSNEIKRRGSRTCDLLTALDDVDEQLSQIHGDGLHDEQAELLFSRREDEIVALLDDWESRCGIDVALLRSAVYRERD